MSVIQQRNEQQEQGFTIVELVVVIVVIAILAAITIVTYNGISARARDAAIRSDVESFAKAIQNDQTVNGSYPASAAAANNGQGLTSGNGNTVAYNVDGTLTQFCLQVSRTGSSSYFATQTNLTPTAGTCSGTTGVPSGGGGSGGSIADGANIQTITSANCPSTRTRAVDARDSRTYWVQKLADGKCWMLTNLAYAGGGTNTYGDVKTLSNSPGSTYTVAGYYVPTGANPTTEPTPPSTTTDGGATNPQYGYLYNWCAAMGAPISTDASPTAACDSATTPAPDTTRSICPAGWRLPTGNTGGEFDALNTAVNGGSSTSDAGLVASPWLGQRSGFWWYGSGFSGQGSQGFYWSSSQNAATYAYALGFKNAATYYSWKNYGFAVRCIAI